MSDATNDCMRCGACCAYFRVSFYWAEADDGGGPTPAVLTEPVTPFLRCMQGSNSKHPRCCALSGEVGQAVRCTIYPCRPSPCREFIRSGENGVANEACIRARALRVAAVIPMNVQILFSEWRRGATGERNRLQCAAKTC